MITRNYGLSGLITSLFLASTASAQVSGTVVESTMMRPVTGATVSLQATTQRTVTGHNGTFTLPDATGSGLVIVAAKKGSYNQSVTVSGGATGVLLVLEAVPLSNDPYYMFLPPGACAGCHPDQLDQWTDSPMANAGLNTWVYDIYDGTGTSGGMGGFVYTRDSVHYGDNPASECASCHQPEPWVERGNVGALEDLGALSDGAMHGISCETCHKIAHVDPSKVNFPGIWPGAVDLIRPSGAETQVQFGVYEDASFALPSVMRPAHQPQLTSTVCAACHQDKNDPDNDGEFEESNGVISEPTYLEWLATPYADPQSPLAATCVDCHMPSYGATRACSLGGVPERDPEEIRHHRIEGTTATFLENAAEVKIRPIRRGAHSIEVQVDVTNSATGHHLPTGVTVRNMILLVEAWREADGRPLVSSGTQVVHDLGGIGDPAQGYYAGLPGKFFAKVNHDASLQGPTFFTDATGIQFDNRIPALETDTSSYSFRVLNGTGAVHVRARLIYRRAFRFLVDAKAWTEDGHGNPLEDVQAPHFGHLMEQADRVFRIRGRSASPR